MATSPLKRPKRPSRILPGSARVTPVSSSPASPAASALLAGGKRGPLGKNLGRNPLEPLLGRSSGQAQYWLPPEGPNRPGDLLESALTHPLGPGYGLTGPGGLGSTSLAPRVLQSVEENGVLTDYGRSIGYNIAAPPPDTRIYDTSDIAALMAGDSPGGLGGVTDADPNKVMDPNRAFEAEVARTSLGDFVTGGQFAEGTPYGFGGEGSQSTGPLDQYQFAQMNPDAPPDAIKHWGNYQKTLVGLEEGERRPSFAEYVDLQERMKPDTGAGEVNASFEDFALDLNNRFDQFAASFAAPQAAPVEEFPMELMMALLGSGGFGGNQRPENSYNYGAVY